VSCGHLIESYKGTELGPPQGGTLLVAFRTRRPRSSARVWPREA
jgi:hypothetical protein